MRRAQRLTMLKPIVEVATYASVSPEPHSIAIDGETVWIASRATRRIDVIDRATWKKTGEIETPGMPWGMTYGDGAIVMTCGESAEDNRRIRRFVPGGDFDAKHLECPGDTGSHLAMYNGRILLGQWYNQKLLLLGDDGSIVRSVDSPHGIAGVAVKDGSAYIVATDDEDGGKYWITAINLENGAAEDLAVVPFPARGLAWDGKCFWTNYRAADRTVAFRLPV